MSFLEFLILHFSTPVSLVKPLPYRYTISSACKRLWLDDSDENFMTVLDHELACPDCQDINSAPLWYDDASYIAYQSYDGAAEAESFWNSARNEPWRVSLVHGKRQSAKEWAAYREYLTSTAQDFADAPF